MKKTKLFLILIISIFIFNTKVLAGATLSVNTSSISVGDSFTVTVNLNSVAAWNIHVSSSGPVSNCSINQANVTEDALDTSKSFSTTCTTTGTGTVTVTLSGDVTSASNGVAVPATGTKTVTIKEKSKPADTPKNNNNNNNTTNTNVNNNKNNVSNNNSTDTAKNNKSSNNNLKSVEIEGFKLESSDNLKYTLTVNNSTEKINIKTVKEDEKAIVKGDGEKKISVGDNTFEIVVTAENGSSKTYTILVTRKDSKYKFDDIDNALKDENISVNVILEDNNFIPKEYLEKISSSGKTVNFNKYNDQGDILYSWIVDGNKVNINDGFNTNITFNIDNKDDVDKLINYADTIYINFKHTNNFPKGTKVRIKVNDKYKNGDVLKLYYYNEKENNIKLINDNVVVKNGYIEMNIDHGTKYVITKSTILEEKFNIYKLISIISSVIIIGLLIFMFIKFRKNKNNNININSDIDNKSFDQHNDIVNNTCNNNFNNIGLESNNNNSNINDFNNNINNNSNINNFNNNINNNNI